MDPIYIMEYLIIGLILLVLALLGIMLWIITVLKGIEYASQKGTSHLKAIRNVGVYAHDPARALVANASGIQSPPNWIPPTTGNPTRNLPPGRSEGSPYYNEPTNPVATPPPMPRG